MTNFRSPSAQAADLHDLGHDAAQAHGARHRRRRHHQGVLSGVSARQECGRSDRLASSVQITRARWRIRRGTSPASARRYWCCSASNDSWRTARSASSACFAAVLERGLISCAQRGHHAVVCDPSECDHHPQLRHLGDGGVEEVAAGSDLGVVGLFSGGTQRTALVMRQSSNSRPSSACAPYWPRANL